MTVYSKYIVLLHLLLQYKCSLLLKKVIGFYSQILVSASKIPVGELLLLQPGIIQDRTVFFGAAEFTDVSFCPPNFQVLNERMAQEVAAADTHEAVSLEPVIQGSFTAASHADSSRHAEPLNPSKLSALGGSEFSALVKGIF